MTSLPRARSILYAGLVAAYGTSTYRFASLQALGQKVRVFNPAKYHPSSQLMQWMRLRYPYGPLVAQVNRDLRRMVTEMKPDVVWFDKPMVFTTKTMDAIRRAGAKIVFYVQDAPFGPRNDGCWRQFNNVYRMADLHCLVRKADVARYKTWGLPWIETMFSFDSRVDYPPPAGYTDAERDREVSYIGHPHEERPQFLLKLARDYELHMYVNGNLWEQVLTPEELKFVRLGDYFAAGAYREAIWRSKINLSFVTEDNEDDIAHKAVETAACGGFLLALRTEGHQALFEEDSEAVFFSSIEECADKARFYLGRPDLREAIAARGRERAVRSGYDNDTQLARILNRLDGVQM